ncbi:uncharacterized protein DUF4124 [Crenobacter luteus]|uniref:DUF4124 domain-containing protein n=1 Tax=Crenobacter luteus TaxID=1452487 RepID=UPI00104AEE24|nr:DUF4124 domain-containing protein [Crenobacter luteus]TCP15240.1 uncharacterized protein DUF4124 [Crenobacter luteus]
MRPSLLAVLLACAPALASATLFKWVDEQGRVHYSDRPPLQAPQQGVSELDRQGRVKREAESAAQQRAREADEAARRAAEAQVREAARRDRALLESYRGPADVERERDRRLAENRVALQGLLAEREALAAKSAGDAALAAIDARIARQRAEAARIRARADADIQRLRLLHGEAP